jgi:hypothetical protein
LPKACVQLFNVQLNWVGSSDIQVKGVLALMGKRSLPGRLALVADARLRPYLGPQAVAIVYGEDALPIQ